MPEPKEPPEHLKRPGGTLTWKGLKILRIISPPRGLSLLLRLLSILFARSLLLRLPNDFGLGSCFLARFRDLSFGGAGFLDVSFGLGSCFLLFTRISASRSCLLGVSFGFGSPFFLAPQGLVASEPSSPPLPSRASAA